MKRIPFEKKVQAVAYLALYRSAGTGGTDEEFLAQSAWFIDPQNSSGSASNDNVGNSPTAPIKDWHTVLARYGTTAPLLRQDVTYTFLSSHVDNTDPVIFHPYLLNGAKAIIRGLLNASTLVSTGTLAGVVSKNRAAAQLLQAITGGTPGQFLVNETQNGRGWIYSGASLTQPLAPAALTLVQTPPAEVDTYSNGDTFALYAPTQVNIVDVSCTLVDFNPTGDNGLILANLTIFDPLEAGDDCYIGNSHATLIECASQRFIVYSGSVLTDEVNVGLINCSVLFGMYGGKLPIFSDEAPRVDILGGNVGTPSSNFSNLTNCRVDGDVILASNGNDTTMVSGNIGLAYIEAGCVLVIENSVSMFDPEYGASILWGPGSLNVIGGGGSLFYPTPAASAFLLTGGMTLSNQGTGYSLDAGGTWIGGVAITPANLDAAIPAGFGGTSMDPQSGTRITSRNDP